RLYFDGVKVAERLGPICYPYEPAKPNQGPYWKAGLYCWGWGSQYTVAAGNARHRVICFSDFRIADANGNINSVRP
ncbi:MAG TPA: hypothetical protein VGE72_05360, partial [Azospirillum sp.]